MRLRLVKSDRVEVPAKREDAYRELVLADAVWKWQRQNVGRADISAVLVAFRRMRLETVPAARVEGWRASGLRTRLRLARRLWRASGAAAVLSVFGHA